MLFVANRKRSIASRFCGIVGGLFLLVHPCAGWGAEKPPPPLGEMAAKRVLWINDGDTIVLEGGTRVRYLGIDAPEIDHEKHVAEPFGYEARLFNRDLVHEKRVRLELDAETHDRYGRILAYVFIPDGLFVNQRMIEKGYAYFLNLGKNLKYQDVLLDAQRKAMAAGIGIWGNLPKTEIPVVGNLGSRKFHTLGCGYGKRIKDHNRMVFPGIRSAFQEGLSPCRACLSKWWQIRGAGER